MGTLSIINAAVFDGVPDGLGDGPVYVAGGRIVSVGGPPQPADQVLDAHGGTVLPGLIDAHCHAYGISLGMMAAESQPLSYVALAAARRLGRALTRGFTTVRDPAGGDAGLARAIAEKLIPSPRYLWTGAAPLRAAGSLMLPAGSRRSAARHAVIARFTSAAGVWHMLVASTVAGNELVCIRRTISAVGRPGSVNLGIFQAVARQGKASCLRRHPPRYLLAGQRRDLPRWLPDR